MYRCSVALTASRLRFNGSAMSSIGAKRQRRSYWSRWARAQPPHRRENPRRKNRLPELRIARIMQSAGETSLTRFGRLQAPELAQASDLNPESTFVQGDMRTFRLGTAFDAVLMDDTITTTLYLIRDSWRLRIETDHWTMGLFSLDN